MDLVGFLPVVEAWFRSTLGDPTPAQARGWAAIQGGSHALIAAPTGTGKTLAAFLWAIDRLLARGEALPDATAVLYVSPLKALGNDIRTNLQRPLDGIRALGAGLPAIRVAVRSGDTPAAARAAMIRKPPHILVTTPESLAIMLTSASGQRMLGTVRTAIVDEIHATAGDKRGAHLALSLERLEAISQAPVQRIGLSATQKPVEDMARLLCGVDRPCTVVDAGHLRQLDLEVEVPPSPLGAICTLETWEEVYARMAELIASHRSTLVFVNTRMLAERIAARLGARIGADRVACHHGSLSRERRQDAEARLKSGALSAMVATASLELGIDIGEVDLVIQLGPCRSIATFLQRVGRAGHGVARTPKGRLFPLTIAELAEAAALMRATARGELDRIPQPRAPLDILAQHVVGACANHAWDEDALFALMRRAWPYRTLAREQFDAVVALHTRGKGLLHRDGVNRRLRGTRRARMVATTSGGAIPDTAQFQVRLEPEGQLIGHLDEDFSIEAHAGDIIQLGASSWRILRVESKAAVVRVADAGGLPPTIPFWLGEGPARTRELSAAAAAIAAGADSAAWLTSEGRLPSAAALQLWHHLSAAKAALGDLPGPSHVIAERFFDESGGTQVVIHAPFGARINRAWGLALRKRICGSFGFELEAAATDDAILLSLAPVTTFPLADILTYLSPVTVRAVLVQACITGGQFETRWRWNATRSLLVERFRSGKKSPAFLTRLRANDALVEAFPAVLACAETLPQGPIELPAGHPLIDQTIHDCLTELMDIDGLIAVLSGLRDGSIRASAVELGEPSPLAQAIVAAKPYAFLDDTPLEERRVRSVAARPRPDPLANTPILDLDPTVVAEIRRELWPDPRSAEEVHEALLWMGFVTTGEAAPWSAHLAELAAARRVEQVDGRWFAAEAPREPAALLRGRLEALGPIASPDAAITELEARGEAVQARLAGAAVWCNRRILARIHRRMRERAHARVSAVSAAAFLRFLARWQAVETDARRQGPRGLAETLDQLAGYEAPAPSWAGALLPARMRDFRPEWLDSLGLSGEYVWGRFWSSPAGDPTAAGIVRTGRCAARPSPGSAASISRPGWRSRRRSIPRASAATRAGSPRPWARAGRNSPRSWPSDRACCPSTSRPRSPSSSRAG